MAVGFQVRLIIQFSMHRLGIQVERIAGGKSHVDVATVVLQAIDPIGRNSPSSTISPFEVEAKIL